MRKLLTMFAAMFFVAGVSAQTVKESKTFDNFYIGLNGGVSTKTLHNEWLNNLNSHAGLRIGRNFTPVFGLAAEGNSYFSWHKMSFQNVYHTTLKTLNVNLLATVNLNNWFAGYPGSPRVFEVVGIYGLGWLHGFGTQKDLDGDRHYNGMTSKAGMDLVFNLGRNKAWQFYVEPAINWIVNGSYAPKYDLRQSWVQLTGGIVYKFVGSNDSHNFTIAHLRDQAEIDALNVEISRLRDELAKKPKEVEVIKEVIKEVPGQNITREVKVENLVFVTFAQAKSDLTTEAMKALDSVKPGRHVQVVGTASPEGDPEANMRLSEARAQSVADYLTRRGVVVDEATGQGVQGTTSNRIAIVYVK